ncbi:acyl-CoA thioesterase [Alkalimarinus coralli]|uniref:acyl-CoA thioesterase n=1 Tax=Alkalimarinus coralli TaxID=2935863 RepID=UPI00202B983E|nr:acyl-CoA thioesterase II [Alkalimarinus coralli]
MTEVLAKLVELLALESIDELNFRGNSENLGFRHVFGGQVLGQALMASSKTVEGKNAHSMHAYFLRPGDHSLPIEYEVQLVRDGATFSTRRVIARQQNKEIFTLIASFQSPEEGFEHQFDMPETSGPEGIYSELETRRKFKALIPEKVREQYTQDRPIEIRPVNPINYLAPDIRQPYKQNWFRAIASLPDDPAIHQCILAYASDFGLLGTSMLPHGVSFMDKGMQVASLDHAIWFHRDFRVDDWLLYDMDSPSASRGRGLNRGNIYNQEGVLVASVCQEALIRKRK